MSLIESLSKRKSPNFTPLLSIDGEIFDRARAEVSPIRFPEYRGGMSLPLRDSTDYYQVFLNEVRTEIGLGTRLSDRHVEDLVLDVYFGWKFIPLIGATIDNLHSQPHR